MKDVLNYIWLYCLQFNILISLSLRDYHNYCFQCLIVICLTSILNRECVRQQNCKSYYRAPGRVDPKNRKSLFKLLYLFLLVKKVSPCHERFITQTLKVFNRYEAVSV